MTTVDFETKVARKFLQLQQSAEARSIKFDLSLSTVRKLLLTKRCKYSKVLLKEDNFSVDRVDNSLGYVEGNVVACDKDLNTRKGQLSVEELLSIVRVIKNE